MRRKGSRYGLKPTNRSLKFSMQYYQDVKGCIGLITFPNDPISLSLKKQCRWKYINTAETLPDKVPPGDVTWHESYTTLTSNPPSSQLVSLQREGLPVVSVEYIGRYEHISHRNAIAKEGTIVQDYRHKAFSTACCCGCSMCSSRPRNKAMKKTKGRLKHRELFLDEVYDYEDGRQIDLPVLVPNFRAGYLPICCAT